MGQCSVFEEPISTILYSQMEFWQGRSGWWGNRRAESYYRCLFLYLETFALILKLQRFAYSGHGKGGVPCRTGDIKNKIKFNFSEFFWNFPKLFRWKWRKSRGVMIQVASDQNHLHGYRKIHPNDDQRNNNCDDQAPSPSRKRTALPRIRSWLLTSQTPLQSSLSTYWSNVIVTNYYWWKETWSKI